MSILHQPIKIGTASSNAAHAADLGKMVFANGKIYVVVKAGATIATAAQKGVVTAVTAGVPTYVVDLPTNAVDSGFYIVPAGQVGSTGTTSLISGDYFLAQVSGPFTGIAHTGYTLVASELERGMIVNSLGSVRCYPAISSESIDTISNIVMYRNCCRLTNTAVKSGGDDITGVLAGLI